MKGSLALLCLGVMLGVVSGCDHVQDPWVSNEEYLAEERSRTPEQTDELRHRTLKQAGGGRSLSPSP